MLAMCVGVGVSINSPGSRLGWREKVWSAEGWSLMGDKDRGGWNGAIGCDEGFG